VNKADGDLADAARRAAGDLAHAVHLLRPKRAGWLVPVLTASAREGTGVADLWEHLTAAHAELVRSGLSELREAQSVAWMWSEVTESLVEALRHDPNVRGLVPSLEAAVAAGEMTPATAAGQLLDTFVTSGAAARLGAPTAPGK